MTTGRHYLTGQWLSGSSRRFSKTNPAAASQVLGDYPIADAATVDALKVWRAVAELENDRT